MANCSPSYRSYSCRDKNILADAPGVFFFRKKNDFSPQKNRWNMKVLGDGSCHRRKGGDWDHLELM